MAGGSGTCLDGPPGSVTCFRIKPTVNYVNALLFLNSAMKKGSLGVLSQIMSVESAMKKHRCKLKRKWEFLWEISFSPCKPLVMLLTEVCTEHQCIPMPNCCLLFCNGYFLMKRRTKCPVCCTSNPHYFLCATSAVQIRADTSCLLRVPLIWRVLEDWDVSVINQLCTPSEGRDGEVSLQKGALRMLFLTK